MTTPVQIELHRGGCVCRTHELRITGRCLVEDLGMTVETSFEDALRHPIVQAFQGKRLADTGSGKTVGPWAGGNTLFHLGVGDDHRGATWFDMDERVVWLCAYGWHRSGQKNDAFQLFTGLLHNDEIYPTTDDYRRLLLDRQRRFVDLIPRHADVARARAMKTRKVIIEAQLGHPLDRQLGIRIIADVVADIAEIFVAFDPKGLNHEEIMLIVRSFVPEPEVMDWDWSESLAGTALRPDEIAVQLMTSA
jgi:hypothetical protein